MGLMLLYLLLVNYFVLVIVPVIDPLTALGFIELVAILVLAPVLVPLTVPLPKVAAPLIGLNFK